MNKQQFVDAVILKVSGKVQNLQPNTPKYNKIIGIANRYIQSWQNEYGVDWKALYDLVELGAISEHGSVELPENVRKVSDDSKARVQVVCTDGRTINYQTTNQLNLLDTDEKVCSVLGRKIIFPKPFKPSDDEYGAAVRVPSYLFVKDFSEKDTTGVPTGIIPEWLIFITAAEYGRNDILKRSEYNNMIAEANQVMRRMIADNRGQQQRYKVGGGFNVVGRTW